MIEYKSVSLANQVFERIEYNILSGEYAIGEIISEKRLAAELGVSRTPIREAAPMPPKNERGTLMTRAQGHDTTRNTSAHWTLAESDNPARGEITAISTAKPTTMGV